MWQTIDKSQATEPGTYRFRFSYPEIAGALVPNVGTPKTWNIMGYQITLDQWSNNTASRVVTAIVRVETVDKFAGMELTAQVNNAVMQQGSTNPYNPIVRTLGGYVKAAPGITPGAMPVQKAFAPALIPLAEIALAVAGLVFIYLSLTSVEKLVESPAVNVALIAGAAVVVYILYTKVKR